MHAPLERNVLLIEFHLDVWSPNRKLTHYHPLISIDSASLVW